MLSGLLLEPERPHMSVVVSAGVAIRKERYLRFAREGAARGAAVLLYDYRAQGGSAGPDLRKDLADFSDWGRLDMPAAINHLHQLHPDLKMAAVGHSAGGWITGLADNYHLITRHAFICVGWAYIKLKPLSFRMMERFMWHVHGPMCLTLFGYVPKGGPWQGEPLNQKLFREWKRWCLSPTVDAALLAGGPNEPQFYDKITAPIRSFAYRDDPIANERTVPIFLEMFPKAEREAIWAAPGDFGLKKIGHDGLFSGKAAKAWAPIWDWVIPAT
jgi:predicted alpha/beta hydrolase